jgi:hypothetical protein
MSEPLVITHTLPRPAEPAPALGRILGGTAFIVAVFDFCFWHLDDTPGSSVAVFFAAVAAIIGFNRLGRPLRFTGRLILLLLAASLLETVVETGFTNAITLIILIVAWAGETYFTSRSSFWHRLIAQASALAIAPGRLLWLGLALINISVTSRSTFLNRSAKGVLIVLPSLLLVLIFGSLLSAGNLIFSVWTHDFFDWIWTHFSFVPEPMRIMVWVIIATPALALLYPSESWKRPLQVLEKAGRWPDLLPQGAAFLSSALVLGTMNLLFLIANIADALFLWSGGNLTGGATYSDLVHHGVNALTFTVLLSALVLTSIFQQALPVARRRELKILAFFWIVQNLFLLLSVGLRLKLYMDAYDVSVERLGVIIFLVLVAAGYALLAVKISRDKSLWWLIGGCLFAIFVTFFITQFLNLGGWAANTNEARWERDRSRHLDVNYLYDLGPAAWLALARAEKLGGIAPKLWEKELNLDFRTNEQEQWREFSLRAHRNRAEVHKILDKK